MRLIPSFSAILLGLLFLAACSMAPEVRTLPEPGPASGDPAGAPGRAVAVLVAPVGAASRAAGWAEGRDVLAAEIAADLNGQLADLDAEAFVLPTLPAADDPAWAGPPPAAAARADVVVLLRLVDIDHRAGAPTSQGAERLTTAIVELRLCDRSGRELPRRRVAAVTDWQGSPKLSGAGASPEAAAARRACARALPLIIDHLRRRAEAPAAAAAQPRAAGEGLALAIDSEPSGADILVDGAYRGTTPQSLRLPARETLLRLERQGHQPWERRLVPAEGMVVKPVLLAVPAPEPAASATPPASHPPAPAGAAP